MTTPPAAARFSVVIPAHDEAAVVRRCLEAFVPALTPGEAEVVVVANGCTDDTADVARAVPGVTVVELAAASKTAALNAGDAAVTAFPRVYVDADITVDADTLRAVTAALREPGALAAGPSVAFALDDRPASVRAFYRAYRRMPYLSAGMIGTGMYALSSAGRDRFGPFPDVTADDLFVQRQFAPGEIRVLPDRHFVVQAPRRLGALVAVRTRVARGNAELAASPPRAAPAPSGGPDVARTTGGSAAALVRLVRSEPRRTGDVAVYVAVTLLSRARARRRRGARWDRDDSSR